MRSCKVAVLAGVAMGVMAAMPIAAGSEESGTYLQAQAGPSDTPAQPRKKHPLKTQQPVLPEATKLPPGEAPPPPGYAGLFNAIY